MNSPIDILTDPTIEVPIISLTGDDKTGLFQPDTGSVKDLPYLQPERRSITHEFQIDDQRVFATIGLFDDGSPAELLILAPMLDSSTMLLLHHFARSLSIGLQSGVSLISYAEEFSSGKLEIIQVIFHWLLNRFDPIKPTGIDNISRPRALEVAEII